MHNVIKPGIETELRRLANSQIKFSGNPMTVVLHLSRAAEAAHNCIDPIDGILFDKGLMRPN